MNISQLPNILTYILLCSGGLKIIIVFIVFFIMTVLRLANVFFIHFYNNKLIKSFLSQVIVILLPLLSLLAEKELILY